MNFQTMNKQRKLILMAAALGVIAAFLPWKTISAGIFGASMSQGVSGFQGIGILAFLVFLGAGIISLVGDQTQPLERNFWLGAMGAGVIALICAVVNIINTNSSGGFGFVDVGIGFGCWIAVVAAIGVTGAAWLFKSPAQTLQSSTPVKNNTPTTTTPSINTDGIKELERLVQLRNAGHITEEEFQLMKSKVL